MFDAFTHAAVQDKISHSLNLECLSPLVEHYLVHTSETADQQVAKLNAVVTAIFPPGAKKLTVTPGEPLQLFTDLALAVCRRKLDYGMEKIVLELLKNTDLAYAEYLKSLNLSSVLCTYTYAR
jgi:hypothetical protein